MALHKIEDVRDRWKEQLRDKAEIVVAARNTPAGAKLLDLLADTFEGRSLRGDDPHDTYYRLGQRDVVQYLRELEEVKNG